MKKIEIEINRFSSKKLKDIIESQSNAYSEKFIDFAKSELIRRGEIIAYDSTLTDELSKMPDDELKNLVEKIREDYHLEYIELAIQEYLKRGFKNDTSYDDELDVEPEKIETKSYPMLRAYSTVFTIAGVICFIGIFLVLLTNSNIPESTRLYITVFSVTVFGLSGIAMLATSEAIKVFLAIEENTRKSVSEKL